MDVLLGRQSILDREQKIIAYELLFRSTDNTPILCDTNATATVLSNTLTMFTENNILGSKRGFINIGLDMLKLDMISVLPPQKFVIEILETVSPTPELIRLIQTHKRKGFIFALDDFIITKENLEYWLPVIQEVEIIKVDVMDTKEEELRQKTSLLSQFNVKLLAEKVETIEMFKLCYELGYDYFQGFFFTKPVIIEGKTPSVNIQGLMQLIQKLQQDAEVSEIEESLKLYPDIALSLLRIANSASVAPVQTITSIKQTIALLGKKALTQWLLLMIYSQRSHAELEENQEPQHIPLSSDPIFLLAAQRGKMMEKIISNLGTKYSRSTKDEAFLTGLLSLSDIVLNIPLNQIIKELHVSENISDALLTREGIIGNVYSIVLAFEHHDFNTMNNLCKKLDFSTQDIVGIYKDAIEFSQDMANNI